MISLLLFIPLFGYAAYMTWRYTETKDTLNEAAQMLETLRDRLLYGPERQVRDKDINALLDKIK